VVRADLSTARPAAALTRRFERDRWQLVDYSTAEGVAGTMVYARPEHDCPALTLPLACEGPHRVFLGMNFTNSHYPGWSSHGQLDVKLTRDPGFRRVAAEMRGAEGQDLFKSVIECYWKTADLTGQDLILRQPQPPYRWPREANLANLAYVRLEPVSARQLTEDEPAPRPADRRNLALIYCTAQLSGSTDGTEVFHPATEQWFVDDFEAYRGTDVGIFVFEALRGNYALYRSRLADVGADGGQWGEGWVDPLAAFTRLAHADGMRILGAMRMIGPQYPMITAPIGAARHYWRNPQWTKRDRDGRPVGNLSLAFPEVRQFWLSLLREVLDAGVDGLHLHLNRSTPFVLYEEPVVRDFVARYGEDPRKLDSRDERYVALCAEYLTRFVREVRKLVDERPGRMLGVTVFGPTKDRPEDTRYKGKSYVCDVPTWLRAGLVDLVVPSQYIAPEVLREWRALGGARVKLWPDLMPRQQPPERFAALAQSYADSGADGFALWDGERRQARLTEWAALRRCGAIGRLGEIASVSRGWHRRIPLETLGGLSAQDSFRDG
jgi:hypothetical protein